MNTDKLRLAFPELSLYSDGEYFSRAAQWRDIFEGEPPWKNVAKSGLYHHGIKRRRNMLGTGKILCDEFARQIFCEQADITCGNEVYDDFLRSLLNREGFWKNIPLLLSKGFAQGGCAVREYIKEGRVSLDFVEGRCFYPVAWDNNAITEGVFLSEFCRGDKFYSLFELHKKADGGVSTENRLYCSDNAYDIGQRVPLSKLWEGISDTAFYPVDAPLFQYFKPDISNNMAAFLPLGISVYANCSDTLKSLDIAFDSLSREFILGKKRIIVPSSCVQTFVDPESGETRRCFDTDDEVYQAMRCEEGQDLKITDNTTELRIEEHVKGINALLNLLCFQVGLSPGTLSFDAASGVKTATEVISQESRTAKTVKANKNLMVELIENMCSVCLRLGMETGEIPHGDFELNVAFRDSVVIDDNTLIDNNVKLVSAGLKSRLSAMMDVLKCDEQTAKKELERITAENEPDMVGDEDNGE